MVKKKIFWKSLRRLIIRTKMRYINLIAVVAIGVSFFVGVTSSAGILARSVSFYNEQNNLKDVTIYSNYGFTKEDLVNIQKQKEVKKAEASYFEDVRVKDETSTRITRIHSYNPQMTINKFQLVKGRMPLKDNEVLAEKGSHILEGFALNSHLKADLKDDSVLKYHDFKVVGLIETPLYLNQLKENSTLKRQDISTYLYIPETAFKSDRYQVVNLLLNDHFSHNQFTDKYQRQVDQVNKKLKNKILQLGVEQGNHIYEQAIEKYHSGEKEYQNKELTLQKEKELAYQKINVATSEIKQKITQIDNAKKEINNAYKSLNEKEKEFIEQRNLANQEITFAKNKIQKQKTDLLKQKDSLINQQDDLLNQIKALKENEEKLISAKFDIDKLLDLEQKINLIEQEKEIWGKESDTCILQDILHIHVEKYGIDSSLQVRHLKQYLNSLQATYQTYILMLNKFTGISAQDKLNDWQKKKEFLAKILNNTKVGLAEIKQGIEKINQGLIQLDNALTTVKENEQLTNQKLAKVDQKLRDAYVVLEHKEKKINLALKKINNAKQELSLQKNDADQKFKDAFLQLKEAKNKLADKLMTIKKLKKGEWIYLDRTNHYASVTFKNTVKQMKAIARIFPVFFILVATLVCLTTMTRLVEEDRSELGTLRALGYKRSHLLFKYSFYSISATWLGLIIGIILGMAVFPAVIYHSWRMMFILPPLRLDIPYIFIMETSLAFLLIMFLATWFAIHVDTKEVPAMLMRPKAPKAVKTILLEKFKLIWNHLSFLHKVTLRNLVRYKKRFMMTLIGIAGCSALMLTGFGIRDSIGSLINLQYHKIIQFDGKIEAKDKLKDLQDSLANTKYFSSMIEVLSYPTKVKANDHEKIVEAYIASDQSLRKLFKLTDMANKKISFGDQGLIVSRGIAKGLKLKEGDMIQVESKKGQVIALAIKHIVNYYTFNGIWLNDQAYQNYFKEDITNNYLFVKAKKNVNITQAEKVAIDNPNVDRIDFSRSLVNNFNQMKNGLNAIVWVLIFSSMVLAFVVLHNLISLNIAERVREIATLKVLGFRKSEISRYILQENILLTIIAALLGLPLGVILNAYIMQTIQVENIIFPIMIHPLSYLYAFLLTFMFSSLVAIFMRKYIYRVKMVESLKSLE